MPDDSAFYYLLNCPCGTQLRGDSEDEIVDVSFDHLRAQHPGMVDDYEREHVLFMALKLKRQTT